jgi:hypothetical protein
MGYVKVKKAGTAFDVVCAENVGTIKADGSGTSLKIEIKYLNAVTGSRELTLTSTNDGSAGGGFTQADIQAMNEAVGLIGGGAGMIDVSLSNTLDSITIS